MNRTRVLNENIIKKNLYFFQIKYLIKEVNSLNKSQHG